MDHDTHSPDRNTEFSLEDILGQDILKETRATASGGITIEALVTLLNIICRKEYRPKNNDGRDYTQLISHLRTARKELLARSMAVPPTSKPNRRNIILMFNEALAKFEGIDVKKH